MKFNKKYITALLLLISSATMFPLENIIAKDNSMVEQVSTINKEVALSSALTVQDKDTYINYTLESGSTVMIPEKMAVDLEKARKEKELEEQKQRERETITVSSEVRSITEYTNLSAMRDIDTSQMNKIIDFWDSKCGGTPFKNKGQVFIDASKASGLDPVYILAHAATESGWGKKHMSHNYFGIGAYDSNPENAHSYGNSDIDQGIIQGAKWISEEYYNIGQTSLYEMNFPTNPK